MFSYTIHYGTWLICYKYCNAIKVFTLETKPNKSYLKTQTLETDNCKVKSTINLPPKELI